MGAAWIRTIDEDEADGELKLAYDRVRAARGGVANIFKAQSLDPKSLQAHLDLYLSLMFGAGGLSRREREMVAVVVSAVNGCDYCVEHHSAALRRYVKDEGLVADLGHAPRDAKLDSRDRAAVDYAMALTKDPSSVTKNSVEGLRAVGMTDEEILRLNLIVGYFNFVNRVANGLGVELEERQDSYKY